MTTLNQRFWSWFYRHFRPTIIGWLTLAGVFSLFVALGGWQLGPDTSLGSERVWPWFALAALSILGFLVWSWLRARKAGPAG